MPTTYPTYEYPFGTSSWPRLSSIPERPRASVKHVRILWSSILVQCGCGVSQVDLLPTMGVEYSLGTSIPKLETVTACRYPYGLTAQQK